jgi:adenosine deaminase
MHLSGAVYAETFIADAAADHLCVNPTTFALAPSSGGDKCAAGQVPAANALKDQSLDDQLVDAFSMRGFVPHAGVSAHDQFFSTFARFSALGSQHGGEWVDEVATRAAAQNEQYLEIMYTPPFSNAAKAGYATAFTPDNLLALRAALLAGGLRDDIALDRAQFASFDAVRNQLEHCGTPQAAPACAVTVRYLYQVLRGFPPQQVFAQSLLAFEVASTDPSVVGLNFVMPEDGALSMRDYRLQMQMLDYLHSVYPAVHISLHAGELAYGLVSPDGLKFHIRDAVELGHAERIGHGVDVMYEDNPQTLLREMAARHIMVEINLTSNDVILGVAGEQHPLPMYLAAHVPVALSTDDEGVSRIDLTHEYERAVEEFHLGYYDLKRSARTSIEHSFLPGADLWAKPDVFMNMNAGCNNLEFTLSATCSSFLKSSEKAQQEWELERRFRDFEAYESQMVEANPR